MLSTDALPADVLQEFGQAACLCRLPHLDEERQAVHEAIFGSDPEVADATAPTSSLSEVLDDTSAAIASEEGGPVIQRRRSFAHYLSMVSTSPAVVDDPSAFREALWSSPMSAHDGRALVAGHWAALIAKDVWQDALCSVWSHFCRTGLARTRALGRGLTWPETKETVHALTSGLPALQPEATLSEVTGALAAVELGVVPTDVVDSQDPPMS